jgi:hypothetical protein
MRSCIVCGNEYTPTGPAHMYCVPCGVEKAKEAAHRGSQAYHKRRGALVGVGSGNNQSGSKNHMWKGGVGAYSKLKTEVTACERCGKLRPETDGFVFCTHHKDENRYNNSLDNLEVLCKRCHQLEHNCISNLPNKV